MNVEFNPGFTDVILKEGNKSKVTNALERVIHFSGTGSKYVIDANGRKFSCVKDDDSKLWNLAKVVAWVTVIIPVVALIFRQYNRGNLANLDFKISYTPKDEETGKGIDVSFNQILDKSGLFNGGQKPLEGPFVPTSFAPPPPPPLAPGLAMPEMSQEEAFEQYVRNSGAVPFLLDYTKEVLEQVGHLQQLETSISDSKELIASEKANKEVLQKKLDYIDTLIDSDKTTFTFKVITGDEPVETQLSSSQLDEIRESLDDEIDACDDVIESLEQGVKDNLEELVVAKSKLIKAFPTLVTKGIDGVIELTENKVGEVDLTEFPEYNDFLAAIHENDSDDLVLIDSGKFKALKEAISEKLKALVVEANSGVVTGDDVECDIVNSTNLSEVLNKLPFHFRQDLSKLRKAAKITTMKMKLSPKKPLEGESEGDQGMDNNLAIKLKLIQKHPGKNVDKLIFPV